MIMISKPGSRPEYFGNEVYAMQVSIRPMGCWDLGVGLCVRDSHVAG